MKVLLVGQFVEPPFAEGIINTVFNWAKASRKQDVDISVFSTSSKLSGVMEISGVPFEFLKISSLRFQDNLKDIITIQKELLKKRDFDILHFGFSTDHIPAVPFLIMHKTRGYKIINSFHTCYFARSHYSLRSFLFNSVTVPSKRVSDNFLSNKVVIQEPTILPPCIDESRFRYREKNVVREQLGIDRDTFVIFTIGHFKRGRSISQLVEVVNQLSQKNKIHLLIGWTGHGESNYINEILGSIDRKLVTIIPPTPDINLYYNAADVYVLSAGTNYVVEMPLSLIEAAFSGTPAIGFDINGVSEIISDGRTGFIIWDNSFITLKNKLTELIQKPEMLKQLSKNSRERALKIYSHKEVGSKLRKLYEEIES